MEHPPVFGGLTDPFLLGLVWGVIAIWWVGLFLGIPLAVSARISPHRLPPLLARDLVRPLAVLLACMAVCAFLAGVTGWANAQAGKPPHYVRPALSAVRWAHNASYLSGICGGFALCAATLRRRLLLMEAAPCPPIMGGSEYTTTAFTAISYDFRRRISEPPIIGGRGANLHRPLCLNRKGVKQAVRRGNRHARPDDGVFQIRVRFHHGPVPQNRVFDDRARFHHRAASHHRIIPHAPSDAGVRTNHARANYFAALFNGSRTDAPMSFRRFAGPGNVTAQRPSIASF